MFIKTSPCSPFPQQSNVFETNCYLESTILWCYRLFSRSIVFSELMHEVPAYVFWDICSEVELLNHMSFCF